jgi:putative endonuclease
LKKERRYVGMTKHLDLRLKEHNEGKNRSTKGFAPFELVHVEEFEERTEARKREKHLKSGIGREFLDDILK